MRGVCLGARVCVACVWAPCVRGVCLGARVCLACVWARADTGVKRVFITNVKGKFFGMSESGEASKRR
jgi:hypothetical protein